MLHNLYLNFLCTKFASSWTNTKQIREGVPVALQNNLFDLKKDKLK